MKNDILIRTVTKEECSWLEDDLLQGTTVYHYSGHTYGCISPDGTACTMVENELPFFEVPNNALASHQKVTFVRS